MSRRVVDQLACVSLAAFPLQILLQAEPAWREQPVVIVEDDRPQARVLHLNARARQLGVRLGQRYATALALAKDLRAGTMSPLQIDQRIKALTEALRRFSPHVEPSTQTPGVFWLDVHGLNRLYPALRDWAHTVRRTLQCLGFDATIAVGFTRFGVYALATSHTGITVSADAAEERAAVQRIPNATLDIAPDVCARLLALGIDTVGAFLQLPSHGIRQRFGEATATLYQLATGERAAPLAPVPPDARHERQVHFDAPEIHTERLIFIVKRLLDSLLASLVSDAQAVVEIALCLTLDDRTMRTERVRPAASTLDSTSLLALLRLRLDALRLPAGIITLRIAADTCPATAHQSRLFAQHTRRDPEAATQAFARLRAEFHERVVVHARLCDAHLPDAQFVWEPIDRLPIKSVPRVVTSRSLVRRVYTPPVGLPAGSIARSAPSLGPYILSGGWWSGDRRRDYYFISTRDGQLQWVYFDHRRKRYFLQGTVE